MVCKNFSETSARTNFFPQGHLRRWEVTLKVWTKRKLDVIADRLTVPAKIASFAKYSG